MGLGGGFIRGGNHEKWPDSGCMLKGEPSGWANILDIMRKRKRG